MADDIAACWRRVLKRRLVIAASVLLVWSAAIEARLVFLQVVRHEELSARADRQQMRTITAPAKRGEILDRRGRVLAYSVDADSIYAVPTEIGDATSTAAAICGALEGCTPKERNALVERFETRRPFVYVKRKVTPDQARRVAALQLQGVGFMKEDRRFYPNKDLGAHLLGYVGLDNEGLGGIEAAYDSVIKGRAGTVLVQTDARRQAFSRLERPPTAGATLELTVDHFLQHIVERELGVAVDENRARGGSAVVMDPTTGEILALASWPTFNPNSYQEAHPEARRNRAVQDLYEPGSTFKIVTASAALEQELIQPDDLLDVRGGSIQFGSRVINDTHDYGVLSFTDVLVKSSNVGAIKVGLRLGPERLSLYIKRFGFGRRLSPDFPGENPGIVWNPAQLTDSALASISMGYQVGVTPLQMAAAVSAIANGGYLMEPRAVRAVIRDGRRMLVPHETVQQSITAAVAAELTTIMEAVVERGTGMTARIPGYMVAGKTGTAKKLVNGDYRGHSDYNASFVGFVPSRKPVFTIVVAIDSPHGKNGYYGGPVAAPVFQRIAEAALHHYGVPPTLNPPPPLLVAAREERTGLGMSAPVEPPAIVTVSGGAKGEPVFPDFRGMSAREALRALAQLGQSARLNGAGFVIDQQPQPGALVERGGVSTLWLRRDPVLSANGQP